MVAVGGRRHRHWLVVAAAIILLAAGCGLGEPKIRTIATVEPIQSDSGGDAGDNDGDNVANAEAATDDASISSSSQAKNDSSGEIESTSEPDASPIPLEQWQSQLEKTCDSALGAMLGVNPFDQVAWTEAAVESLQIRQDGIRQLPMPVGFESQVDELLGHLDHILAVHTESGTEAVVDLMSPDSELTMQVDRLSVELGIEDCGKPASDPAICDRVPIDLIKSVLGQVPPAEHRDQLGAQGCLWEVGDDSLAFQTGPLKAYAQVSEYFRQDGRPVPGIGDEAFLVDGFSSVTGGSSRGSTLWVVFENDVYAVAAIVDDASVDSDVLVSIVSAVMLAS